MRKVIATGDACIDAPEGKVCIDPKSQHTSHTMRLVSVGAEHSITVEKDYGTIKPYWLGEIGCDLTKKDPKGAVHAESTSRRNRDVAAARVLRRCAGSDVFERPGAASTAAPRPGWRSDVALNSSRLFYQFADVFAFLILSAAGLAIMFGMMGVINMAHGEFIMCGAYVTVGLVHAGLPLPLAQSCRRDRRRH